MTVTVAHRTTRDRAIELVDRSSDQLLDFGSAHVRLTDQKKSWKGAVMEFSLVARAGFIALPVAGSAAVDDVSVVVVVELPGMVRKFVGEEQLAAIVEKRLTGVLGG